MAGLNRLLQQNRHKTDLTRLVNDFRSRWQSGPPGCAFGLPSLTRFGRQMRFGARPAEQKRNKRIEAAGWLALEHATGMRRSGNSTSVIPGFSRIALRPDRDGRDESLTMTQDVVVSDHDRPPAWLFYFIVLLLAAPRPRPQTIPPRRLSRSIASSPLATAPSAATLSRARRAGIADIALVPPRYGTSPTR